MRVSIVGLRSCSWMVLLLAALYDPGTALGEKFRVAVTKFRIPKKLQDEIEDGALQRKLKTKARNEGKVVQLVTSNAILEAIEEVDDIRKLDLTSLDSDVILVPDLYKDGEFLVLGATFIDAKTKEELDEFEVRVNGTNEPEPIDNLINKLWARLDVPLVTRRLPVAISRKERNISSADFVDLAFTGQAPNLLAGINGSGETFLWEVPSGKLLTKQPAVTGHLHNQVRFSPDGRFLVTWTLGSGHYAVCDLSLAGYKFIGTDHFPIDGGQGIPIQSVAISPTTVTILGVGDVLISPEDPNLGKKQQYWCHNFLFNLQAPVEGEKTEPGHWASGGRVEMPPGDGSRVVRLAPQADFWVGVSSGGTRLKATRTWLKTDPKAQRPLEVSFPGLWKAESDDDHRVWKAESNPDQNKKPWESRSYDFAIRADQVEISDDGQKIALAGTSLDGEEMSDVFLWLVDEISNRPSVIQLSVPSPKSSFRTLAFSGDGKTLIATCADGSVHIWRGLDFPIDKAWPSRATYDPDWSIPGNGSSQKKYRPVALNYDGNYMAVRGPNKNVEFRQLSPDSSTTTY